MVIWCFEIAGICVTESKTWYKGKDGHILSAFISLIHTKIWQCKLFIIIYKPVIYKHKEVIFTIWSEIFLVGLWRIKPILGRGGGGGGGGRGKVLYWNTNNKKTKTKQNTKPPWNNELKKSLYMPVQKSFLDKRKKNNDFIFILYNVLVLLVNPLSVKTIWENRCQCFHNTHFIHFRILLWNCHILFIMSLWKCLSASSPCPWTPSLPTKCVNIRSSWKTKQTGITSLRKWFWSL